MDAAHTGPRREVEDEARRLGDGQERLPLVRLEPSVVLRAEVVRDPLWRIPIHQRPQPVARTGRVVGGAERAVEIGEQREPAGVGRHHGGHVVVVGLRAGNAGRDDERVVDAGAVHLQEQVGDAPAGLRVGHLGLVGPVRPEVRMRVDDERGAHPLTEPAVRPFMTCWLMDR